MPKLTISTLATSVPMGQQVYEEEIAGRATSALGPSWKVRRAVVRTLRSPLEGNVRLPARLLTGSAGLSRRLAGLVAYQNNGVVHRMDLRLPPAWGPEILTIHDVVPWRFPDEARPPEAAASEARRSLSVVCPSSFSANEVATVLGVRNVSVIPQGVNAAFFSARPLPEDELRALGLGVPFVLHAGGGSLRKNLGGLAEAWPLIHRRLPGTTLALMGPRGELKLRLFGAMAGTKILGRLDDEKARSVMAAASVVVVPSLYEGFGLPALEGMAAGVAVVAANRASLPEVCGDGALLVEPTGPALAEGVLAALGGGPDISAMVSRGQERASTFTWEICAARHADLWRSAAH
jgi:glycosyltransferase involved in cell wall biosynthesis